MITSRVYPSATKKEAFKNIDLVSVQQATLACGDAPHSLIQVIIYDAPDKEALNVQH